MGIFHGDKDYNSVMRKVNEFRRSWAKVGSMGKMLFGFDRNISFFNGFVFKNPEGTKAHILWHSCLAVQC